MTMEYDEDVSENPFFRTLLQSYVDLFSQCVCEKWIICIPQRDSLPKHSFSLEDFAHHILRPLNTSQEMTSRRTSQGSMGDMSPESGFNTDPPLLPSLSRDSSSSNLSRNASSSNSNCGDLEGSSSTSDHLIPSKSKVIRKWNFRTLADVNVEYSDSKLLLEHDQSSGVPPSRYVASHTKTIHVLFEETFYTPEKKKYKILCVASPLNSKVEDFDPLVEEGVEESVENVGKLSLRGNNSALWTLTSLRDCIDFLWLNARPKTLELYDAFIRLFLHNHRTLQDLPLPVQRDLVFDLYAKCLAHARKSTRKKSGSLSITGEEELPKSASVESVQSIHNFRLATETYVLSGIYRQLMSAISADVCHEDGSLNKILRNLSAIHPQDLDIDVSYWDVLLKAKKELSRLNLHASPLGKLTCLRKTMRILLSEKGSPAVSEANDALSADELLPIWVYLIIKTPLDNWMANLQFLRHFRFSALDTPDNEHSFYIVTLEASLTHLHSGKICGLAESERDVGVSCDPAEFWLKGFYHSLEDLCDTPFGNMLNMIRQGSSFKLEELVTKYELERVSKAIPPPVTIDKSLMCHPLCDCPDCYELTRPVEHPVMESIFELSSEEGLTLLHAACIYGRPKIVDYLLDIGAPCDVQDNQGMTPLHYAASRGHQNALLLILHAGANLEAVDQSINTPLHLAALNGHEPCVKALIYFAEHSRQSINVSCRNCTGDTPLHFASRLGFRGIVQILVENGASITSLNARQRSPHDLAHNVHILRILQGSLRRRSLVQSNHGDFVNIEVMPKADSEGVIMLISDPPPVPEVTRKDSTVSDDTSLAGAGETLSRRVSRTSVDIESSKRSRRNSFGTSFEEEFAKNARRNSSLSLENQLAGGSETPSRSASAVSLPVAFANRMSESESMTATLRKTAARSRKISMMGTPPQISSQDGIQTPRMRKISMMGVAPHLPIQEGVESFYVPVSAPPSRCEAEHLRKTFSEDLNDFEPCIVESSTLGNEEKLQEKKERDIKKLFGAIRQKDLSLALFYLGIPAKELELVNEFVHGEVAPTELNPCHPLCPCDRCGSKAAGLGLDINICNDEGLSPIHVAAQCNLSTLVKILLKYGADPSLRSVQIQGKTPLDYAKEKYYEETAEILQKWKATE